jgi:hypothetical protein
VRPPKKRISISFAFCGSFWPSAFERIVDGNHGRRAFHHGVNGFVECAGRLAAAALACGASARVIHQNLPHDVGRNAHEVGAATIVRLVLAHQTDVSLMHQGRGLQRMIGAFPPQMAVGEAVQLGVHQRHQAVQGRLIASREIPQDQSDRL